MLDGWNARFEQARRTHQQQQQAQIYIADGMSSAPGQDPAAAHSSMSQDAPRSTLSPKKRPRPSLKAPNSVGTNRKHASVRFADTADIRIIYQATRKEAAVGTNGKASSPQGFVAAAKAEERTPKKEESTEATARAHTQATRGGARGHVV